MSAKLQYRLQQMQQAPPVESWKIIAERLDAEFSVSDSQLATRVEDFSVVPPAANWSAIASVLDAAAQVNKPDFRTGNQRPDETPVITIGHTATREARGIPFRSIAAVLVVVLAVGLAWFLNRNAKQQNVQPLVNNQQARPQNTIQNTLPDETDAVQLAATVPSFRVSRNNRTNKNQRDISFAVAGREAGKIMTDSDKDIRYASVESSERRERDPILVPNNPIRDANGNIIMDEKLVSSADKNYVTVTGPNGEQTRISKKFLHALSYMNSAATGDEYLDLLMHEGSLWKWLFQEWRTKLIQQPSFIPTATNFLDIMELKEILHENF